MTAVTPVAGQTKGGSAHAAPSKFAPLFLRKERAVVLPDGLAEFLQGVLQGSDATSLRHVAASRLLALGLPHPGDEAFSTVRWADILPKVDLAKNPRLRALSLDKSKTWLIDESVSQGTSVLAKSLSQVIDTSGLLPLAYAPNLPTLTPAPSDAKAEATGAVVTAGECTLTHTFSGETQSSQHSLAACRIALPKSSQAQLGIQLREESSSQTSIGHLASTTLLVELAADAQLDLWISDFQSETLFALTQIVVHQAEGSRLKLHLGSTGTALSRTAVRIELAGPNAQAEILGTAALSRNRQSHRYLHVIHQAPGAQSKQLFKTVAADTSRSSVDGTIEVAPMAKGTVASQTLRNLLLGETARVDSKPRLLIRNDDVKCNHGSTTGQLDDAQRFYLRSRGLSDAEAVALLTGAFLLETLDAVPRGSHREPIETILSSLLGTT
jgi:SUF system FeS cluster assembly, SufBD